MIEKKIRKHGNMLPISIRGIICGPSNCDKTNVLISLLESPHDVRFENVYIYSKSFQQPKYRYLKNLLTPIEEISYFTYSNNSNIVSPSEALPNSIFIFDDVACDKQDVIRVLFNGSTRMSTPFISVRHMQRYQSILYATTQISWFFLNRMLSAWNIRTTIT